MPDTSPNSFAPQPAPVPRSVIIGCYVLLAGLLVYALVARWFLPLYLADPIGVDRPAGQFAQSPTAATLPASLDNRIDPNTADWPELTRLPGIGEVTAKRIVAYRQEHRGADSRPVFRTAKDLGRVRGIGPKTVEALTPHLKFSE